MPAIARCLLVALLVLCALPGCGGGGGGSGGNKDNGGSGNPFGNAFAVLAGPSGGLVAGLNSAVSLTFNKKIDPASVNGAVLTIVTISDPSGQATAPAGTLASVTLSVDGKRLIITPTIDFSAENVFFGFEQDALFEIAFSDPATGNSIRSVGGDTMVNSSTTYLFRTPDKAVDKNPGFPQVRAWLVPDPDAVTISEPITDENGDGSLFDETIALFDGAMEILEPGPTALPISPVSDVLFVFDDALLPQTVLNPVDSTSPAVRVLINTATVPQFVPIVAPATLQFFHQQDDLTLLTWTSDFEALPPTAFLIAEVTASVQDLGCNSKVSVTGDSSPSLSASLQVVGGVDGTVYEVVEPFDNDAKNDVARTSARWAEPVGELNPVLGGGRGLDGPLVVDADGAAGAPGETQVPLLAVIDWDTATISLPTVIEIGAGLREPRTWEFTRLVLPAGWTLTALTDRDGDDELDPEEYLVSSPGHPLDGLGAPLQIKCTESMDIAGAVVADGVAAEDYEVDTGNDSSYFGQGSAGAVPVLAAGAGGRGGDSLLVEDTDDDGAPDTLLLPLDSPVVEAPGLPFESPLLKRIGVTGRSEELTASTLVDWDVTLDQFNTNPVLAAMLAAGELRLQPNVGVGSTQALNAGTPNQFIDENHPSFVITDVDVTSGITTITVDTSDGSSMIAASDNAGTGYAPIAAAGDCYVIGRFAGADGLDAAGWQRGGRGAAPYLVVNEGALGITTTGGGGGGGGGIDAGSDGGSSGAASDPTVNQRGIGNGISTGISQPESAGAPGGLGAPRGTAVVIDDVTLDLVTSDFGADLADLGGAALVGAGLVPNAPDDGWLFRIASFDGTTFVVERIQKGDVDIGLTSGPAGPDGPGLSATEVVSFLVVPQDGLGGGGGGGSGVSVTGTINTAPSVLPRLTPGAGGGAGAGAITLETAGTLTLRNAGSLSARGGDGGRLIDATKTFAGGAGGAGGGATVRADAITLFQGAKITTAGGQGGGEEHFGRGGDGGTGWVRFETFDDDLSTAAFNGFTVPTVREENLGRFVGDPQGVAQSRFYHSGLANGRPTEVELNYRADTDGDGDLEPLGWSFGGSGVGGGPEGYTHPPFTFTFNARGVDPNGFQDADEPDTFYEAYDLVAGRSGYVYDPVADVRLFSVGEDAGQVHVLTDTCLGTGCDVIPFSDIPSVGAAVLDMTSLSFGGVDGELFLLERGQARVHVLDRATGAFLRTITLPGAVDGGMTVLSDGVDPANDRLLIASNRAEVLVTVALRDDAAAEPATTDFAPSEFASQVVLSLDGLPLTDIEITGLAYDPVAETLWCVDAPGGTVFEVDWSAGNEGAGLTGVHTRARLTAAGEGVVLSSVAFDGSLLWLVRAVDDDATTTFALDPATLPTDGGDVALANFGATLPEVAKSVADGKIFLRFRLTLDATFVDEDHPGGPVPFEGLVVDDVTFRLLNASF